MKRTPIRLNAHRRRRAKKGGEPGALGIRPARPQPAPTKESGPFPRGNQFAALVAWSISALAVLIASASRVLPAWISSAISSTRPAITVP